MKVLKSFCLFPLFIIFLLLVLQPVYGQIRSGAAFLSRLPGARLQAMAAGFTSVIDDAYAIYANPGATGFLREWQWTATYTKWIAEVYNTSFIYGRKFNTPWGWKTVTALGVLYQGMPEFDSSDHAVPGAAANDVVVSLSLGQPLTAISENIALGSNLKYLKSTLARYSTSKFIFDMGLMGRTSRFDLHNSWLECGIFSAGIAVTQIGQGLVFDKSVTPLPLAWRMGTSFYAGSHSGLQIQVLGDYYKIKDENDAFGLATEVSWSKRFSLYGGFNSGNDLMSQVSFGASVRLDDLIASEQSLLPGRNNALQLDLATLDEGEFFSRTYCGSITHGPIGPEYFTFITPTMDDSIKSQDVIFQWSASTDPDLYDDVSYTLILDQDSTQLVRLISQYHKSTGEFLAALNNSRSRINKNLGTNFFQINNMASGNYYWVVFAMDQDQHVRFAEKNNSKIAHFCCPYSDLQIKNIEFVHSPWITRDDYHGYFNVEVTNQGGLDARNFVVSLYDSTIGLISSISETITSKPVKQQLAEERIEVLKSGATRTIQIPWYTLLLGSHQIIAVADIKQNVAENDESNNELGKIFHTIPKGTITCIDTVEVLVASNISIDMPIITEISFDENSTFIHDEYLNKNIFDPPIATLAERLKQHRTLKVWLQGFVDPNSELPDVTLANARAEAVRNAMLEFGVNYDQVEIIPGQILERIRIPVNPEDAKWVFEERRHVRITSNKSGQPVLFQPVRHFDDDLLVEPVRFQSQINCAVPVAQGYISCTNGNLNEEVFVQDLRDQMDIQEELTWDNDEIGIAPWLNKNIEFDFTLIDKQDRKFQTRKQNLYLVRLDLQREHRIAFPLKFAQTDPLYDIYWTRLFDQVKEILKESNKRIYFNGHACAVGPEDVNERLSIQRALIFPQEFLKYVKQYYPEYYLRILERLDRSVGFGETVPLSVERFSGRRVLIGDNNKPMGRKLNRRIEISFYTSKKPEH